MRVTLYHALPQASTLIVLLNEKVVGTVSVIRDGPFGVPLDAVFDVTEFRKRGDRIAEISSLAITKSLRHKKGEVLFLLLKFLYEYCLRYFGIDVMLIATHPKNVDFYEAFLCFEKIENRVVQKYAFANGQPAVGLYLDLHEAQYRLARLYANKPARRDLFSYFVRLEYDLFQYPDRKYFKISDPIMTPEMLDYFFNSCTDLFATMDNAKRNVLHAVYQDPKYANVLPKIDRALQFKPKRRDRRYDVSCKGRIIPAGSQPAVTMFVRTVSKRGFSACLDQPVPVHSRLKANIEVGEFQVAEVDVIPVWTDCKGVYGFSIVNNKSETWEKFTEFLEKDLLSKVA